MVIRGCGAIRTGSRLALACSYEPFPAEQAASTVPTAHCQRSLAIWPAAPVARAHPNLRLARDVDIVLPFSLPPLQEMAFYLCRQMARGPSSLQNSMASSLAASKPVLIVWQHARQDRGGNCPGFSGFGECTAWSWF